MACQPFDHGRRVQHPEPARDGGDRPGVADLAPALGVEGRPVEEDVEQVGARGSLLAVDVGKRALDRARDGGKYAGLGGRARGSRGTRSARTWSGSHSRRTLRPRPSGQRSGRPPVPASAGIPSPCQNQPGRPRSHAHGDLLGQVDREPVGVVEPEGDRCRRPRRHLLRAPPRAASFRSAGYGGTPPPRGRRSG